MNNSKIHSDKVESCNKSVKDYSWISTGDDHIELQYKVVKLLPPPPCPPDQKMRDSFHANNNNNNNPIPPPPCGLQVQPPLRSCNSRRRSFRKSDDPFLIAYKECTKSSKKDDWESDFNRKSKGDDVGLTGLMKKKKSLSIFSCKQSCNVTDDNIVKVSKLSISRTLRPPESHGDC